MSQTDSDYDVPCDQACELAKEGAAAGSMDIENPHFTKQERQNYEQVRFCGLDEQNQHCLDRLVNSLLARIDSARDSSWRRCDGCSGDECADGCTADQKRDEHSDEFEGGAE